MLILKAWCLLWAYDVFFLVYFIKPLRSWHYRTLRSLLKNWKVKTCSADPRDIPRVCHAVELACVLYFKHVLCFQKAIVKTYLLRKQGQPALVVVGAQKAPFYREHSWVEINDKVIDERKDVRRLFQVWEKC